MKKPNKKQTTAMIAWLTGLIDGTLDPIEECEHTAPDGCRITVGVCSPFYARFKYSISLMVDVQRYPRYSGHNLFPVRGGRGEYQNYYSPSKNMWDFSTTYGQERKHFVEWVITQLEKNL